MISVKTISIIVLVVLFVFLVISAIRGWRRGFLRILFSTFSIVVTIVISAIFTNPAAALLQDKTPVGPFVQEKVADYVAEKTADILPEVSAEEGSQKAENSPAVTTEDGFIDSLLLPEFIKSLIKGQNNLADYARLQVSNFQEYISLQITRIIVRILAFVALMIVVYILLRLLFHILRFVDKIPIIHGINHFLGMILGLAEYLLIIWLICLVLSLFAGSQFGSDVLQVIHSSKVLTFIYDSNLISMAVKAIIPI